MSRCGSRLAACAKVGSLWMSQAVQVLRRQEGPHEQKVWSVVSSQGGQRNCQRQNKPGAARHVLLCTGPHSAGTVWTQRLRTSKRHLVSPSVPW